MMLTQGKILPFLIAGLIFLLLAGAAFFSLQRGGEAPPGGEITPPKATGKIDDLEKSLLLELDAEEDLFAEEEKDTSLVEDDSLEASGFSDTTDVQY